MNIEEVDFSADGFEDIIRRDSRYDARAYAFMMHVVGALLQGQDQEISSADVLEEFKESALDQYGPLTYTVLTAWGVKCTEDVGEMMFNLVESRRVRRSEGDSKEDFVGGYDFRTEFLEPYQT